MTCPASCPWYGAEAATGVCPKSIACPQCAAAPGARCRRPSEHQAMSLHLARILQAERTPDPAVTDG